MSTVKHRSKGTDKSAPLPQAPDDVAKNKSGKGSKAGSPHPRAALRSSCSTCVALLLLSVVAVAGAGFLAYCMHHFLEEVSRLSDRQEAMTRQKENLDQAMESALKQVHSLEVTIGSLQSVLKEVEQKQDDSERALQEGEREMRKISDVLKKLQDEILKDLSNGIQDVKDARERDFPFFEKNIEEKLTELTTSINHNIALFTAVQKRSENEINSMKARVASLQVTDLLTSEVKELQDNISELQIRLEDKDKAMELLKDTVSSADSTASDNVKELSQLKQGYEILKETVEAQQGMLKTLLDQVERTQESFMHLPSDVASLREEFLQIQSTVREQEQNFSESSATKGKMLTPVELVENNMHELKLSAVQHSDNINFILSEYKDLNSRFAATQDAIDVMRSTVINSDSNSQLGIDAVQSLRESQESLTSELEEIRRDLSEVPQMTAEFHVLKEVVHKVRDLQSEQAERLGPLDFLQSQTFPDKVASLERFISESQSAVSEVQLDLSMLRTAVDNLVTYSVKIETNENKLEIMKQSLEDLRYDYDRLLEKIEKVQEAV
ncbi:LOW QUALITY PROTEIN: cytoskeleton-associated protein 4 [Microcaecilia unicolor]|uniref:LOW QUALITY PROTEIN: cytoskeleton-associated protein 4 n=1 Tax=Microcaecilia unicolor TaxID=1415580 RepID=A0A6P7Z147_9AMPH|nr:LOW QUALITY PROTEIN: cytoskeleton-associated protein 4 [Microcaecilia unicolor]